MIATPLLVRQALRAAAKLRSASFSVVSVTSGYEHSLRPRAAPFSQPKNAAHSESDR